MGPIFRTGVTGLLWLALACTQKDPGFGDALDGGPSPAAEASSDEADAAAPATATDAQADSAEPQPDAETQPPTVQDAEAPPSDAAVPEPTDASTEPEGPRIGFYPMVDGASWSYRHTGGSMDWDENVSMRRVEDGDAHTFEVSDTPGPSGSRSISTLVERDGVITRAGKDEITGVIVTAQVSYDPGFVRFDRSWADSPVSDLTLGYERTARDSTGGIRAQDDREHVFTVESVDAQVSVPAGTFDGCLVLVRSRVRDATEPAVPGDEKRFWFCPGIGKTREQELDGTKVEELLRCDVPGGACP